MRAWYFLGWSVLTGGCAQHADVDAARIAAADREPQNWLSVGRNYAEDRFSPLTSINEHNVGRLGLAWFVDLDTKIGSETTPLVVDGVMYTVGAWNVIYALDAKTGRELWRYDPKPRARLAALHVLRPGGARTRRMEGQSHRGHHRRTPIRARCAQRRADLGCAYHGCRTNLTPSPAHRGSSRARSSSAMPAASSACAATCRAYDADTGKQVWRFYTVPGDPAKGFESKAMEMAAKTWQGEWWKSGGGGPDWDAFSTIPSSSWCTSGPATALPGRAICAAPAAATICSCAR